MAATADESVEEAGEQAPTAVFSKEAYPELHKFLSHAGEGINGRVLEVMTGIISKKDSSTEEKPARLTSQETAHLEMLLSAFVSLLFRDTVCELCNKEGLHFVDGKWIDPVLKCPDETHVLPCAQTWSVHRCVAQHIFDWLKQHNIAVDGPSKLLPKDFKQAAAKYNIVLPGPKGQIPKRAIEGTPDPDDKRNYKQRKLGHNVPDSLSVWGDAAQKKYYGNIKFAPSPHPAYAPAGFFDMFVQTFELVSENGDLLPKFWQSPPNPASVQLAVDRDSEAGEQPTMIAPTLPCDFIVKSNKYPVQVEEGDGVTTVTFLALGVDLSGGAIDFSVSARGYKLEIRITPCDFCKDWAPKVTKAVTLKKALVQPAKPAAKACMAGSKSVFSFEQEKPEQCVAVAAASFLSFASAASTAG